ncbi:MAG: hypothetical protein ACE5NN_03290 [Candidatus Bathyarchaeia archaeon]
MSDIKAEKKGSTLVLTIQLREPRPSSTGKMTLVYTSGGFKDLGVDGLRANITIGTRN